MNSAPVSAGRKAVARQVVAVALGARRLVGRRAALGLFRR